MCANTKTIYEHTLLYLHLFIITFRTANRAGTLLRIPFHLLGQNKGYTNNIFKVTLAGNAHGSVTHDGSTVCIAYQYNGGA